MKLMLTGGGTLGPVTPLLAVVEVLRVWETSTEFVWVGTTRGPERTVVEAAGLRFLSLSVPKLSRHAPLRWLGIPFHLLWGLWRAHQMLVTEKPDVVVSAGGYVSVPIIWVCALLGIPSWIHQQDVRLGLANKLMAPFADRISVAWEKSLKDFSAEKVLHLGNPVRASIFSGSRARGLERFGFANSTTQRLPSDRLGRAGNDSTTSRPTVVVTGGGTGASWINETVGKVGKELEQIANVLHITGVGKSSTLIHHTDLMKDGMADVYAMADVVICRAGMGTISELAALKKAAIIVPMPDSHQEDNTQILDGVGAALVLHQKETTPQMLLTNVVRLLEDKKKREEMGQRLHYLLKTDRAAETLAHHLLTLARTEKDLR